MNANDPAFPCTNNMILGMTIRERFAMAAMQGVTSNSDLMESLCKHATESSNRPSIQQQVVADSVAVLAVTYADTLIAELAKKEGA